MFEISTNGSFTPPSDPPCVQTADRAALLALRAANGLDPQCHYRIPGPTIGTAGNTSPTTIELHAVTTGALGLEAKVFTTFANEAWQGLYDVDLGAAGTITMLADNKGNVLEDSRTDAPVIHTQWPWHNTNFVRNHIVAGANGNFTGLGALTTQIMDGNDFNNTILDATGASNAMALRNNTAVSSTLNLRASLGDIRSSRFYLAALDSDSTSLFGAATSEFSTSSQSVHFEATDTQGAQFINCHLDGYHMSFNRTGGSIARFTAGRFYGTTYQNPGGAVFHANFAGSGALDIHECDFRTRSGSTAENLQINIDGSGSTSLVRVRIRDNGAGTFPVVGAVNGIVRAPASTGGIDVADTDWFSPLLYMNGSGSLDIGTGSEIGEVTAIRHEGGGLLSLQNTVTREVTVSHNSGEALTISASDLRRTTVTPGTSGGFTITGSRIAGGPVTKTGAGAGAVTDSTVVGASTLTVAGGGSFTSGRLDAGATLNTGAFAHTGSIIDGPITITATASNSGRLANASFANWI